MASVTFDCSELIQVCNALADVVGVDNMQKALKTTLYRTGKRAPVQIRKELQTVYDAKPGFIRSGFRTPKISGTTCIIPLNSDKGNHFTAKKSYSRFGTKKKPKVQILKGRKTALPRNLADYGGQPPFHAKGGTYTRMTEKRFPIARVAGVAVSQMPMENSKGYKPTQEVIDEISMAELGRAITAVSKGYLQGW